MALKSLIISFELELFHGSNVDGEPEYRQGGVGDEWLNYQQITLSGFDGRVVVSLHSVWQQAIAQQKKSFTASVIGYETYYKVWRYSAAKNVLYSQISILYK